MHPPTPPSGSAPEYNRALWYNSIVLASFWRLISNLMRPRFPIVCLLKVNKVSPACSPHSWFSFDLIGVAARNPHLNCKRIKASR